MHLSKPTATVEGLEQTTFKRVDTLVSPDGKHGAFGAHVQRLRVKRCDTC